MTNDEAIRILRESKITYIAPNGRERAMEALDMAISALSKMESAETQITNSNLKSESEKLDGDLISRELAKQMVRDRFNDLSERVEINTVLNEVPSAEKTAEEPIKHFGAIECPNCGRLLMLEEQTYGWCNGCKEYDTEKHCCHRYSSFIRESLQENINAVLEDIKAEMAEVICLTDNPYTKQTEYTISHKKVREIIDKHISGKESE